MDVSPLISSGYADIPCLINLGESSCPYLPPLPPSPPHVSIAGGSQIFLTPPSPYHGHGVRIDVIATISGRLDAGPVPSAQQWIRVEPRAPGRPEVPIHSITFPFITQFN